MTERTIVRLPPTVSRPYEIFVNGIEQKETTDYCVFGTTLVFERSFVRAPGLGFWRWLFILCFGIVVGGYHPHDTIDVVHTLNGRRTVTSLTPLPADEHSHLALHS